MSPIRTGSKESEAEDESGLNQIDQNISKHYEIPNLSSVLYEYTHSEIDRIRHGFQPGNF
jgi:hypothetical protein